MKRIIILVFLLFCLFGCEKNYTVREAVSNYLDFLLYQYSINKMNSLVESEEVFNAKMQKGYEDAMEGRCKPIDQAFADIKRRFA